MERVLTTAAEIERVRGGSGRYRFAKWIGWWIYLLWDTVRLVIGHFGMVGRSFFYHFRCNSDGLVRPG